MTRPLEGIRILDLSRLLPGAYATLLLADLGAEVVKIEHPAGGDTMRTLDVAPGAANYFELLNRGKRSVTLDLKAAGAAGVLDALARTADVVVHSFRPSAARRLQVDGEALLGRYPSLVCVAISGFGTTGPHAGLPAHDINYQAMAGLLRPPALPGPLVADVGAAMRAAVAILSALIGRQRSGAGSAMDISLFDSAREWALFPTTADLASPCYHLYETRDGTWLALGALETKFWTAFCAGIARPDLVPLQHARGEDGRRATGAVAAVLRERTADEWLARFAGADVCLARVEPPPRVEPGAGAPRLGADTDAVLERAGIDRGARDALRRAGVV